MEVDRSSMRFYIGAATIGTGPNKWSWPARDLAFLYELRYKLSTQSSLEPDLETWKKFGLAIMFNNTAEQWVMMSVKELGLQIGDLELTELLTHCTGTYLGASRNQVLDMLGCP